MLVTVGPEKLPKALGSVAISRANTPKTNLSTNPSSTCQNFIAA